MKIVSIIPARGGSQGILNKNLQYVGGQRLLERAITTCLQAKFINECVVSSDSSKILEISLNLGASTVLRPTELSQGHSTTESAIEHVLDVKYSNGDLPDIVVLVQCTSPFISAADLDSALTLMTSDSSINSIFSAVKSHSFLWKFTEQGLVAINHDGVSRKMRQEIDSEYLETGAFYAFRAKEFLEKKSRFINPIFPFEVSPLSKFEIDDNNDLVVARMISNFISKPKILFQPKAVVTDFDGVHTDDFLFVNENGNETIKVSRSDGFGISLLKGLGIPILVLSSEENAVVSVRSKKLGIECIQASKDKVISLNKWLTDKGIDSGDVLYVGNDINDLDVMEQVGFAVAVKDAHPKILAVADLILDSKGGQKALRELSELIVANYVNSDRG